MKETIVPTEVSDRIEILDVLRGFAVFGILLSNILIISGYYFTPISSFKTYHLSGLNFYISQFSAIFIVGKAYPIFCMLFGASFILQSKKDENNFALSKFSSVRLLILLIIGLIHLIVWPGDVVHQYALLGFILLPCVKLQPKYLLSIGITCVILFMGIELQHKHANREELANQPKKETILGFKGVEADVLIHQVQYEGFSGMWFFNNQQYNLLYALSRLKGLIFQALGLFFLGAYFMKSSMFAEKLYKWEYVLIFAVLTLVGKYLMVYQNSTFRMLDSVFMSLFFISLMGIIYKKEFGKKLLGFLKPVGRMPLTNYISQSIIAVCIFYGFGLGLFTKLPLYQIYLIAAGILVFQTIFSKLWLNKYKYGPIEWLWRSLSYNHNFSLTNRK